MRGLYKSLAIAIAGCWLTGAPIGLLAGEAQAAVTPADVAVFLANPSQALASNPDGGAKLISFIRDVAVADPTALAAIINLLGSASAAQQSAIGAGLGQAVQMISNTNQDYAVQIQTAVAASDFQAAKTAFAATTGNTIVSTGGGGGGGGGGVGGPLLSFHSNFGGGSGATFGGSSQYSQNSGGGGNIGNGAQGGGTTSNCPPGTTLINGSCS
jgi:hypothetical protein